MICYKDTTFCASKVEEHTCSREFTDQDQIDAEKWWGDDNPPIAFSKFCEEEKPNA